MSTPAVTAVIVTYRSEETVGEALSALKPGHDAGLLRCVVVDNKSPDGSADLVTRDFPWAALVRSPGNLGYGRGCNLGFEKVDTPYVLLMNPDVVLKTEAISTLVDFMEKNPKAGMCAPATRVGNGHFQHAGGLPTPWRLLLNAAGFYDDHRRLIVEPGGQAAKTDWLCGAVMMIPSPLYRDLGGFDPRFFLYFEETDLCLRIAEADRELWVVGAAEAYHSAGSSARKVDPLMREGDCLPQHFFTSRYYYLRKHHGWFAAAFSEAGELLLKASRDVIRTLLFKPRRAELRTRLRGPVFTSPPKSV